VEHAAKHRAGHVNAALTICRAYLAAGSPDLGLSPFGSFERWSKLVRSALVWAGTPDPCESRGEVMGDDPELVNLRNLLAAWWKHFGRTPRNVKELVNASQDEDSPLGEALEAIAGDGRGGINSQKLGMWLRGNAGRIVDKLKLTKASVGRVTEWKVVEV